MPHGRLVPYRIGVFVVMLGAGGCGDRAMPDGEAPIWPVRMERRIQVTPSDSLEPGEVWDLAVDSRNRIYALLPRLRQIRVFDAGKLIRIMGRTGSGPGEFRGPAKLAMARGDTLWVSDDLAGRWSVFDSAGRFIRAVPRDVVRSCRPACGWFDTAGRLVDGVYEAAAPSVFDNVIRWPPSPGAPPVQLVLPATRDRTPSTTLLPFRPYEPRGLFAFDPRGAVWFAFADRYRLTRLAPSGDTLHVIDLPVPPLPIARSERAAIDSAMEVFARRTGVPAGSDWPATKTVLAQLTVADDGHLWVARVGARDGWTDRFDVVDTLGRVIASAVLDDPVAVDPAGSPGTDRRPLLVTGSRLVAVTDDADGNQVIVIGRIVR